MSSATTRFFAPASSASPSISLKAHSTSRNTSLMRYSFSPVRSRSRFIAASSKSRFTVKVFIRFSSLFSEGIMASEQHIITAAARTSASVSPCENHPSRYPRPHSSAHTHRGAAHLPARANSNDTAPVHTHTVSGVSERVATHGGIPTATEISSAAGLLKNRAASESKKAHSAV